LAAQRRGRSSWAKRARNKALFRRENIWLAAGGRLANAAGKASPPETPMSFWPIPTRRDHLLTSGVVVSFLALTIIPAFSVAARAEDSIPQLGARDFGWNVNFWDFQLDPPPGLGHGPMKTDPNFPYNSQIQNGGSFSGGPLQPPIVNTKDPILKPWAAAQMQATNKEVLSGKKGLPFVSQSRCWPGGVPGQLLFLQPMYFLQTPNVVWMIWERDHFARRIYLTDKHSEHVKPSWFGDSIGHYEGGDTLEVDTIGLAAGKYHYIDSFRTPHTEKLHVVERFTISPDGRALTAIITVEDPDTFNGPLTLTVNRHGARTQWRWRRWFAPRMRRSTSQIRISIRFRRPANRISDRRAVGSSSPGTDPVAFGLVDSFNRPGGDITGIAMFGSLLAAKRLEMLREVVPGAGQFGVLVNPHGPTTAAETNELQAAAGVLGVRI
jgi:ABC transporter substrate binding protein